jgi:GMP reductase
MSEEEFTLDDILLVPDYTEIRDTEEYISEYILFGIPIKTPVISSPMDTITEKKMMLAMRENGGVGIHHRYCDSQKFFDAMKECDFGGVAISPSVGIEVPCSLKEKFNNIFFAIDVSHGDSEKVYSYCSNLIKNGITKIISGNIVTKSAVEKYLKIGIKHFRVGVGSGSRCITRTQTGFGFPQGSAVYKIKREFKQDIVVFSDGGARNCGDCCKLLSLGADFIISGYLFSGTDECPNPNEYRGMASKEALETRKNEFFVEGESISPNYKGSVKKVVDDISEAVRQACYYGGVSRPQDLVNVKKIRISNNSYLEGLTRK